MRISMLGRCHSILRALAAAVVLVPLAPAPPVAWAEEGNEAHEQGRELAQRGFEAYKSGDYPAALESFSQARELYPAGQVLRMLGYTQLALEQWLDAAATLEEAIACQLKPLPPPDQDDARRNLERALAHLATVTIPSDVPDARVRIDGGEPEPLPLSQRRLMPGTHQFVWSAPGHETRETQRELPAGSRATLSFDPDASDEPTADEPPSVSATSSSSGAIALAGGIIGTMGLAAAATGIAVLVDGLGRSASVADRKSVYEARYATGCPVGADGTGCVLEAERINRDADRAAVIEQAGIGLLVGGSVVGAAGLVMFLLDRDSDTSSPTGPGDGGDRAQLACGPFGAVGWMCHGTF